MRRRAASLISERQRARERERERERRPDERLRGGSRREGVGRSVAEEGERLVVQSLHVAPAHQLQACVPLVIRALELAANCLMRATCQSR
jgi:hypothetical protein